MRQCSPAIEGKGNHIMQIALWIVNVVLAIAFLMAGGTKLTRSRETLRTTGMAWVDDFSAGVIKLIASAEILGALGLVLPLATGIAPILTPLAAVGLAITMVGAVAVHLRRKEAPTPAVVLGVLAVVSAVLGFLVVLG
ncbi:DoxX family protein [Brooklawnia cerclae]|uniref:Membrane protein YphA (DoxX/SURF4 family) n=1 Tax=Brooklawnia cerclae TaxID=349934 RepID=A0ABX0SH91_9ACTN|nr:DoxX family protein [Brooklawnia cerclae]NIH56693.1 putative membrane protein YphA (DoxX/SURF4 family) [Brooklawnia cerclae]